MLDFGDPRLPARFWDKVMPLPFPTHGLTGCWIWTGALTSQGYGSFNLGRDPVTGRQRTAVTHKLVREVAYPADVRRTEGGVRIVDDHLCETRSCCHFDHTERVDQPTNIARGASPAAANAAKTMCPRGHAYDEANTAWWRGKRYCRACRRKPQDPGEAYVGAEDVMAED